MQPVCQAIAPNACLLAAWLMPPGVLQPVCQANVPGALCCGAIGRGACARQLRGQQRTLHAHAGGRRRTPAAAAGVWARRPQLQ